MPKHVGRIDKSQLIIRVIILDSKYPISSDKVVNKKHLFKALLDTGATHSTISKNIAEKLNLSPIGKNTIISASHKIDVNTYSVHIVLPKLEIRTNQNKIVGVELQTKSFSHIVVSELPNRSETFDVLLGMDVLKDCILIVEGNQFILSF